MKIGRLLIAGWIAAASLLASAPVIAGEGAPGAFKEFSLPPEVGAPREVPKTLGFAATPPLLSFQQYLNTLTPANPIGPADIFPLLQQGVVVGAKGSQIPQTPAPFRIVGGTTTSTDFASAADYGGTIKWTSTAAVPKVENLPACSSVLVGLGFTIKDGAATAGTYHISLVPQSGTIEGAATFSMTVNRQAIVIRCDGASDWTIE